MRVVGGIAGGIPLQVPKTDLRPTMDMVKNAIFNSLAECVPGARVLDLFAGTGGLGIEALSRGAASCVFVESDRRANAAAFDLILIDPPYSKKAGDRDFGIEILSAPGLRRALAPGGIVVLEHMPERPVPIGPEWECTRNRRYGATVVAFLRAARAPSSTP
jgi:16S rRNA (guanine966-N2)-methyltransferase